MIGRPAGASAPRITLAAVRPGHIEPALNFADALRQMEPRRKS